MKRELTLGQKMLVCFGTLAGVALVAAVSLLAVTNSLAGEMDKALEGSSKKLELINELVMSVDAERIAGRNVIVYAFVRKPDILEQEAIKFENASKKAAQVGETLRALFTSEAEAASLREMETSLTEWSEVTRQDRKSVV